MKKIIFGIFGVLFFLFNLSAQEVSIDMSIEWKEESNYCTLGRLKHMEKVQVPYLTITYKNLTGDSIFLVNNTPDLWRGYPTIYPLGFSCEKCIHAFLDTALFKSDYNVIFSELPAGSWLIMPPEANLSQRPLELDTITNYLYEVQSVFLQQESLSEVDSTKQLVFFNYPGKEAISRDSAGAIFRSRDDDVYMTRKPYSVEEMEQGLFSPAFLKALIFLNPQEEYIQTYNLIAFFILGGNYTFYLGRESVSRSFNYHVYYNEENDARIEVMTLPEVIKGYKYVKGDVPIEPVTLKIE